MVIPASKRIFSVSLLSIFWYLYMGMNCITSRNLGPSTTAACNDLTGQQVTCDAADKQRFRFPIMYLVVRQVTTLFYLFLFTEIAVSDGIMRIFHVCAFIFILKKIAQRKYSVKQNTMHFFQFGYSKMVITLFFFNICICMLSHWGDFFLCPVPWS